MHPSLHRTASRQHPSASCGKTHMMGILLKCQAAPQHCQTRDFSFCKPWLPPPRTQQWGHRGSPGIQPLCRPARAPCQWRHGQTTLWPSGLQAEPSCSTSLLLCSEAQMSAFGSFWPKFRGCRRKGPHGKEAKPRASEKSANTVPLCIPGKSSPFLPRKRETGRAPLAGSVPEHKAVGQLELIQGKPREACPSQASQQLQA